MNEITIYWLIIGGLLLRFGFWLVEVILAVFDE